MRDREVCHAQLSLDLSVGGEQAVAENQLRVLSEGLHLVGNGSAVGAGEVERMQTEIFEQTSYGQLVQEIIGGSIRRHTFTQWELELLFDLQTCRVRKSSRPEVLRRYLKAVQLQFSKGASTPLRLAEFIESENGKRPVVEGSCAASLAQKPLHTAI